MTSIIISGHGGYAAGMKGNLHMLMGDISGVQYVDFDEHDSEADLAAKLSAAVDACEEGEILFACDLAGGSPFRQSCILCIEHPNRVTIAGLNTATYAELFNNLELSAWELIDLANESIPLTVMHFPQERL